MLEGFDFLSIATKRIILIGCGLPVVALSICVILCLSANACLGTDCTDMNILPSLSAAISDEQPQRSIWMWFISISSSVRLTTLLPLSRVYLHLCHTTGSDNLGWMVTPTFGVSVVEIFFLTLLSLFPSATQYEAHRNCLAIFVSASVIFMGLDTILFTLMSRQSTNRKLKSRARYKRWLFATYLLLMTIIAACYYIHVTYCPPYVYSLFSFFEYIAIVINVLYQYWANSLVAAVPLGSLLTSCSCSEETKSSQDIDFLSNVSL